MSDQQSIKETLKIIRQALEDDNSQSLNPENKKSILILDNLVKDDGTIERIENNIIQKKEVKEILNKKIENYIEKNFDKWLDKNAPHHLDKYFKKNN